MMKKSKYVTDYLKMSSQLCYGLTTSKVNKFAYNYAHFLEKVFSSWQENKTAREE